MTELGIEFRTTLFVDLKILTKVREINQDM